MATASLCSFRQSSMVRASGLLRRWPPLETSKKGGTDKNTPPNSVHHHRPEFETTMEPGNPRVPPPVPSGPSRERKQARPAGRGGGRSGSLIHLVPHPFCFLFQLSLVRVPVSTAGRCGRTRPDRVSTSAARQRRNPSLLELLLGTVEKDKRR